MDEKQSNELVRMMADALADTRAVSFGVRDAIETLRLELQLLNRQLKSLVYVLLAAGGLYFSYVGLHNGVLSEWGALAVIAITLSPFYPDAIKMFTKK